MSETVNQPVGAVIWADLTVTDAVALRDFYKAVTGWSSSDVDVGGYADYNMHRADGEVVAGICHARGINADLPPQWLVYITVENLEQSMARCVEQGGQVIFGPKSGGGQSRLCVIRDPAGAVAALFEPAKRAQS